MALDEQSLVTISESTSSTSKGETEITWVFIEVCQYKNNSWRMLHSVRFFYLRPPKRTCCCRNSFSLYVRKRSVWRRSVLSGRFILEESAMNITARPWEGSEVS